MANNLTDTKLESQPLISTLDKYVTEKYFNHIKIKVINLYTNGSVLKSRDIACFSI